MIDVERKAWILQRKLKNPELAAEIDAETRRLEDLQRKYNPNGLRLGFIWCGELDKPEVENEEESRLRNVNDEETKRRRNSTGNVEEEGDYTTVDNKKAKGKKKRKVRTAQFSSSPEELARVKHKKKKVRTSSEGRRQVRKNFYEVLTLDSTDTEDEIQCLDGEDNVMEQEDEPRGEKEKKSKKKEDQGASKNPIDVSGDSKDPTLSED